MKFLHTLGLAILAFFASSDVDEAYPGAPSISNAAAAQNCAPPPPPPGSHYEYRAVCTIAAQNTHKAEWAISQSAYLDARPLLEAALAQANEELSLYLGIDPLTLPQSEHEQLRIKIANAKGQVAGLENALAALERGWRNTKDRLEREFYESIESCCHIVEGDE